MPVDGLLIISAFQHIIGIRIEHPEMIVFQVDKIYFAKSTQHASNRLLADGNLCAVLNQHTGISIAAWKHGQMQIAAAYRAVSVIIPGFLPRKHQRTFLKEILLSSEKQFKHSVFQCSDIIVIVFSGLLIDVNRCPAAGISICICFQLSDSHGTGQAVIIPSQHPQFLCGHAFFR